MQQAGLACAAALLLAWGWDAAFGEPRNALHPVAWLGRLLAPLGRRLSSLRPMPAFIGGAMAWCALAMLLGAAAWAWQRWALVQAWPLAALLIAPLLKPCFAWRMLRDEVAAVEAALALGTEAARERLARLVSRDVKSMDAHELRETALSTLAENLNDSVVAPLFWFALAGLPGAVVYRLANTMDAMWGYRGRFEWAGKWAAHADDVLSWVPARLTALLLYPVWRRVLAEAGRTTSPNGGWPMGALALRLDVRLRKPGVYALNAQAASPAAADAARALAVCGHAATAAALLTGAVAAWMH